MKGTWWSVATKTSTPSRWDTRILLVLIVVLLGVAIQEGRTLIFMEQQYMHATNEVSRLAGCMNALCREMEHRTRIERANPEYVVPARFAADDST